MSDTLTTKPPRQHRGRSIPHVAANLRRRGVRISDGALRLAVQLGEVKTDSFGGIERIGQAEEDRLFDLLGSAEAQDEVA
jgi:hypothetical protein